MPGYLIFVGPSEQQSGLQEIGPESRVVQKQDIETISSTDRTLMVKISKAQTPVGSILESSSVKSEYKP